MFRNRPEPLFEIDMSLQPPSCLPTNLRGAHLIDITMVGAMWRSYLNANTGEVHDGAAYYGKLKELEQIYG